MSGGCIAGVFFSFLALGNQIIAPSLCEKPQDNVNQTIGFMTFWLVISGFLGSSLVGIFVDRTQKYGLTTKFNTVLLLLAYVFFTIFVDKGKKNSPIATSTRT